MPSDMARAGRCHYCNRRTFACGSAEVAGNPGRLGTADHLVPKSRNGIETVLACARCNEVRGDAPYELFMHWVTYVNLETDWGTMRKAFRSWIYSLAVEAFRLRFDITDPFVEAWRPAAVVYEGPKCTGSYSRKALRRKSA